MIIDFCRAVENNQNNRMVRMKSRLQVSILKVNANYVLILFLVDDIAGRNLLIKCGYCKFNEDSEIQ